MSEIYSEKTCAKVVVQITDETELPCEEDVEKFLEQKAKILGLNKQFGINTVSFRRLFTSLSLNQIREIMIKGQEQAPCGLTTNLLSYFQVDCKEKEDVELEKLVSCLSKWELVKNAYIDIPGVDPRVGTMERELNPLDDPLFINQRYLYPSPKGIDALYAWGVPGGDGSGQSVIDLEQGWTLNHEDLVDLNVQLLHGKVRDTSRPHGTAVLGEIAARNNHVGCIGIVPNIKSVNVVSYYDGEENISEADAILAAIPHLEAGNVLILEVQAPLENKMLPIEVKPPVFDAIRLAIQHGIVVVEAAGNGDVDLDQFEIDGKKIFNRFSPDFRDSGAIIVGASSKHHPYNRMSYSNYGSRIDCFALGEYVVTCSSDAQGDTTKYTSDFSGTSGATPIVAGAALAVQGIVEASRGSRMRPDEIRHLLSDPTKGTLSQNPTVDRIGVMPNLRAIIESIVR